MWSERAKFAVETSRQERERQRVGAREFWEPARRARAESFNVPHAQPIGLRQHGRNRPQREHHGSAPDEALPLPWSPNQIKPVKCGWSDQVGLKSVDVNAVRNPSHGRTLPACLWREAIGRGRMSSADATALTSVDSGNAYYAEIHSRCQDYFSAARQFLYVRPGRLVAATGSGSNRHNVDGSMFPGGRRPQSR
jgi:hypothetical protein